MVLEHLPSMSSNAEIAEEMYVSVNTIKAHLKSLYRKLEVSSRRAAVRRARELNLFARGAKPRPVRGRLSHRSPNTSAARILVARRRRHACSRQRRR